MVRHAVPLLAAVLLGGCLLNNISADERLRDAAYGLNDELRWSRMDLAVQRVAPSYRAKFVETRRAWGRDIQVGDAEVQRIELSEDHDRAITEVVVGWYSLRTMMLQQTTVRQRWKRVSGQFYLVGENVVGGDPALLRREEPGETQATASADQG